MNHLITGPMFAGKSKYLIKTLDYLLLENKNIKILFIYPKISFRGYFCRDKDVHLDKRIDIITEEEIENNIGKDIENIYNYIARYDIVGIDEFCFLNDTSIFIKLIKTCTQRNTKTNFCIASLDMDYKRNYWESVSALIEEDLIDIHTKVFGKCDCGRKGIYSKRIVKDVDRVVIGDDIYKCVCRYCYEGEDEVKFNL
ncbi:thymidine kinase [Brachyspira hyodysenteriae]|uniref:thymidine kinase n=1 Tax=Brachyspira hyodysenteriae TaxID=159 RepID=UPI000A167B66|nr:thymidine kinase [Brachyspira hyodysenteriae]TVL44950.1 thymidine kinase [Brachyspira hyodysenteriae]